MNSTLILSLGSFIIAGAHYVRNGDDGWYVGWIMMACLMAYLAARTERATLPQE